MVSRTSKWRSSGKRSGKRLGVPDATAGSAATWQQNGGRLAARQPSDRLRFDNLCKAGLRDSASILLNSICP